MDDLDKKFDRAEKIVERGGKLILKVVTGVLGIAAAVAFAWSQLHTTLDEHGYHVHSEDEEFQEYLLEMETSAGYYEDEVDSLYEDSLYADYYHLDTIVEDVNDTDVVYIEEEPIEIYQQQTNQQEFIVELDTIVMDTIN